MSGYDQYRQELLDPASQLDAFGPDAVLLALDLSTALPDMQIEPWLEGLRVLLESYRQRSAAPVFLCTFAPPALHMDGLLSPAGGQSVAETVMALNSGLRRVAAGLPQVLIVDIAELSLANGLRDWQDTRMWLLARSGISPKKYPAVAARIARHLRALRTPAAKCLVLDLDNTVWGGIVGEAGAGGIHCTGESYPGNAFASFQQGVLALRRRGILLAVASKNDRANVDEAFATRAMPLRPEHITEWEVHWEPKSISLQRIAARMNIGLDSLVFLDDNPAEVEQVRQALPMVRAYRMPPRPEEYAAFLASLEDFDQLSISSEDSRRAEMYELRRKSQAMAESAVDMDSFLRSLGTVVTIEPSGPANFERIVQLIHKTNQFNLTTRRHDAAQLRERIANGSELWGYRARDVHGDHGLIAVALLDVDGSRGVVDTFLMSCRVIGRSIETAVLHHLEQRAIARGCQTMEGEWIATPKSGMCRDFYRRHGYEAVDENEAGAVWRKPLDSPLARPEWVALEG